MNGKDGARSKLLISLAAAVAVGLFAAVAVWGIGLSRSASTVGDVAPMEPQGTSNTNTPATLPVALVDRGQSPAEVRTLHVTPPGYVHALVRGALGGWYEFDYPEAWQLDKSGGKFVDVVHFPNESIKYPWVKLTFYRTSDFEDKIRPPGTISSTLVVDGRAATKYMMPPELVEGSDDVICWMSVDIGPAVTEGVMPPDKSLKNGIRMTLLVFGMENEAACQPYLAAVDPAVVQSIHFVPAYGGTTSWDRLRITDPLTNMAGMSIFCPTGWSASVQGDAIHVQKGPGAWPDVGAITMVARPGQPRSYYDNAQDIVGSDGLRWVGSEVHDGARTTEYATSNQYGPVQWRATVLDLPEFSEAYLMAEQAVWGVMAGSSFLYDAPVGYP